MTDEAHMRRILMLCLLGLTACASPEKKENTPVSYDNIQARGRILDVRERDEVEAGTIAGSLWVPLSEAKSDPKKVRNVISRIVDGKEIFVYCRSGRRSQEFMNILGDEFKATNLGGYEDLLKRGFPKGYYIDYSSFK